jgi:hypothetical protein
MDGKKHTSIWSLISGTVTVAIMAFVAYRMNIDTISLLHTGQSAIWKITETGLYCNIIEGGVQIAHIAFHNSVRDPGSQSHYKDEIRKITYGVKICIAANGLLKVVSNAGENVPNLNAITNGLTEISNYAFRGPYMHGGENSINIIINDIPNNDLFINLLIVSFFIKQQHVINIINNEKNDIEISFKTIYNKYHDLFKISSSDYLYDYI